MDPSILPCTGAASSTSDEPTPGSVVALPRHLHTFARQYGLGAKQLIQLAWSVVLQGYLGSSSICFGYASPALAGESLTPEQLDEIRVALDKSMLISELLSRWNEPSTCHHVERSGTRHLGESLPYSTALLVKPNFSEAGIDNIVPRNDVW